MTRDERIGVILGTLDIDDKHDAELFHDAVDWADRTAFNALKDVLFDYFKQTRPSWEISKTQREINYIVGLFKDNLGY